MKLFVVPQMIACEISPVSEGLANTAMIRITTDPHFAPLQFKDEFMDILELRFADVTDDDFFNRVDVESLQKWQAKGMALHAITEDQARAIVTFAERMRDQGCHHMVVHCQAGFSRSPAVAMALAEHLDLKEEFLSLQQRASQGHFAPNPTVLQRIREVTGARDRYQQDLEELFSEEKLP